MVATHESLLQQAQQEVGQLLRDSQQRAAPSSGAAKELQRLSQQVQVRLSWGKGSCAWCWVPGSTNWCVRQLAPWWWGM